MDNKELQHHGIIGMKWGVRRFQNKDGSLTPKGKKRYTSDDEGSVVTKIKARAQARAVAKAKAKAESDARDKAAAEAKEVAKAEAKAREVEEKRAKLLKSIDAKEIYENRQLLTTQEINERLNRIDTERRLSEIAAKDVKSGYDRVNSILKFGKKANEVYEFTNTPMMKAIKKNLFGKKEGFSPDIDKVWRNRDNMSDEQLTKVLKRITTEKTIKKMLDELNS